MGVSKMPGGTYPGQSLAFGQSTQHDYQMELRGDGMAYSYADVILADGRFVHYTRTSPGTGYTDAVMVL
jgi:hypothetical protein